MATLPEGKTQKVAEKFGDRLTWDVKRPNRIYVTVDPDLALDVCRYIFRDLYGRFAIITGIHTPEGFELLYHFEFPEEKRIITVKTLIRDRENPRIQSLTPDIPGAGFIEREIRELLGIEFVGHPEPEHLLLVDDWPEGKYPLRRDYHG